jgi:glycosyltransferase involved in cell wall biosynthesis
MSGAERSLLELLAALPYDVDPVVACPQGEFAEEVRRLEVPVVTLPGTGVSFRLHPWHTAWGLARIGAGAGHLRRLAHAFAIRIVHANSIRSGIVAGLASSLGGPPTIVHVRDCMPRGRTADLVRGFLRPRVAAVLANSDYTARNFMDGAVRPHARVVYNAVDLDRFDPERVDRGRARATLGLGSERLALGVVSQITPWKAQDDAIRIIDIVRRQGVDASLFIVGDAKFTVGAIRYDNELFERSLHAEVVRRGLSAQVHFLGDRHDVPEILRALDLVLVPSSEEPFGRIVIEAMAMETPVIATDRGGPPEILAGTEAGLLLPPGKPDLWAAEAIRILADPGLRQAMGAAGRAVAGERFTRQAHVEAVLGGYEEVIASRTSANGAGGARRR